MLVIYLDAERWPWLKESNFEDRRVLDLLVRSRILIITVTVIVFLALNGLRFRLRVMRERWSSLLFVGRGALLLLGSTLISLALVGGHRSDL